MTGILKTVSRSRWSDLYQHFTRGPAGLHGVPGILHATTVVINYLHSPALFSRILHIVCTSTTRATTADEEQAEPVAVADNWSDTCHTLRDVHEHLLSRVQEHRGDRRSIAAGLPGEPSHGPTESRAAQKQLQGPASKSLMQDIELCGNQFANTARRAVAP